MWTIPKIWEGGTVWIIGGGPSIPKQFEIPESVVRQVMDGTLPPSAYSPYMKEIHKEHIIGVNMAYKIGDWIDMIVFGDGGFFLKEKESLANFPGLKISLTPHAKDAPWVKYVGRDTSNPKGLSPFSNKVCWNQNTGSASIDIAVHTGAKRIILLGFDMSLGSDKMQHWHNLYKKGPVKAEDKRRIRKLPFDRHLAGFPIIAEQAKKLGVEILNACPESAIVNFPKLTVKEVLERIHKDK